MIPLTTDHPSILDLGYILPTGDVVRKLMLVDSRQRVAGFLAGRRLSPP